MHVLQGKILQKYTLQGKVGPALFAAMTVMTPSWLTASEPDALEEKRLADQCSATHGGSVPEAFACQEPGAGRFAVLIH